MRRVLAIAALVAGASFVALGAHVAIFGAERPLPEGPDRVEGDVLDGTTTPSPAGEPALYGRVRVRSAAPDGKSMMHVDRTFGDPGVRVGTAGGPRALHLPSPDDWRVPEGHDDRAVVEDLAALPLLEREDVDRVERAMPGPYEVTVRAVRPGDHVVARAGATASRVAVGDPSALARDGAAQDAARFPIVALLLVVGIASCVAGALAWRGAARAPERPAAP